MKERFDPQQAVSRILKKTTRKHLETMKIQQNIRENTHTKSTSGKQRKTQTK